MKKNNLFKYIFIIVIIVLAIVTYSFYKKERQEEENIKAAVQEAEDTANVVKELRLSISQIDSINPIVSHNKYVQEISKIIFDSLITLDENYNKQYSLATEISKIDDLTYIVKLRDDVKWSDGTEFKAEDVRYTAQLLKNINSVYSANIQHLIAIDILDDQTLKFTLDQAVPFFEYNLTFPIMSSEYYADSDFANSEKTNNPLGTGMFKIVSYDEKVIGLEKNTEYWNSEKNSVLEKININIYGSMGEVYNDFKNGNIDAINTSQSSVNQYIGSIGFASLEFSGRDYDYVAFNVSNNYLASANVRNALSYYVDKNNIIASCYGNSYRISDFPLDYGNYLYQTGIIDNSYNSELASTLLTNDGWVLKNNSWQKLNGKRYVKLSFSLTVNGDNNLDVAIAENLRQQWANAGINVTIKKVSTNNYYNILNSKTGYDAVLINMSTSFSPNLNTYLSYGNYSNYSNEEINQILADANNISDSETLKEKFKRVIEIYNQDKPFMSISRKKNVLVYNTNLVGNLKPTTYNIYNNIEKWYRKNY